MLSDQNAAKSEHHGGVHLLTIVLESKLGNSVSTAHKRLSLSKEPRLQLEEALEVHVFRSVCEANHADSFKQKWSHMLQSKIFK